MENEAPFFPFAALQTLTASRWTILAARIFGKKVTGRDGDCTCTAYKWRGKLYFTNFEHLRHNRECNAPRDAA